MAYPDPIIGYRQFVDGVCRAVFEDSAGRQYVMDDGGERVYGSNQRLSGDKDEDVFHFSSLFMISPIPKRICLVPTISKPHAT